MTFDLHLWPLTSWTCEGSYILSTNQIWFQLDVTFSNEVNFTFGPHLTTWPLMTFDHMNLQKVPYCINKPSLVPIGLKLFKWDNFYSFSLSYHLTSDDIWPWYVIFDFINKWGFSCCIYDPTLVEIHQSMWKAEANVNLFSQQTTTGENVIPIVSFLLRQATQKCNKMGDIVIEIHRTGTIWCKISQTGKIWIQKVNCQNNNIFIAGCEKICHGRAAENSQNRESSGIKTVKKEGYWIYGWPVTFEKGVSGYMAVQKGGLLTGTWCIPDMSAPPNNSYKLHIPAQTDGAEETPPQLASIVDEFVLIAVDRTQHRTNYYHLKEPHNDILSLLAHNLHGEIFLH